MSLVDIRSVPSFPSEIGVQPTGPRLVTGHHTSVYLSAKEFDPFRLDTINQCLPHRLNTSRAVSTSPVPRFVHTTALTGISSPSVGRRPMGTPSRRGWTASGATHCVSTEFSEPCL